MAEPRVRSLASANPRRGNAFASLGNRDFRYLTIGTVAIGFGQWGQQVALNWLMFVLTGSAVELGKIAFVGGMLLLVLTPFGGIISDRYPRRTVIIVSTIADAVQAAAIAVMVFLDIVQVWHVYAFALLTSVTTAAGQPARQAYVSDLIAPEELPNAIAMNSIGQNVSRIAGPSLAGALTAASVGAPFLFVSLMRGFALICTLRMSRRTMQVVTARRNPLREIGEGFAYLFADPVLRVVLLVNALPAMLIYPYMSFMPVFAREALGRGSAAYGVLVSAIGVGSVVGLTALAFIGDVRRKGLAMMIAFCCYLSLVLAFTQSRELWQGLAILATAGIFHGFAVAMNNTIMQTAVVPEMRGRGMAAWQMAFATMPLGALPMGMLIGAWTIRPALALFFSICLTLFILITLTNRAIRRA